MGFERSSRGTSLRQLAGPALALGALSLGFEALFVHHGLGWFDEAWPLYAARQLSEGGRLYHDVFFLFPPGHLLPAWLATWLDPPGLIGARWLYALLGAAGVVALYGVGRRMLAPPFAFLAAALLALAAPESHLTHLLFGHRYLLFPALGLLAFARYLEDGRAGWMGLAGACAGIGLAFRLSPAAAVSLGIGIATVAGGGGVHKLARAFAAFSAGLLLATLPVLVWLATGPGLDAAWREVVVRLYGLQWAQSLPVPALALEGWDRDSLSGFFVALQYRLYPVLVVAALGLLSLDWIRARQRRRAFGGALPLAVAVWGGVYLVRVLGRADDHHLYSCLPPLCLLLAWGMERATERLRPSQPARGAFGWTPCAVVLLLWIFLMGSDRYLAPERRGTFPVEAGGDVVYLNAGGLARAFARKVETIRRWSAPEETLLSVSLTPIFHLLADRSGPGHLDLLMPGTFLDDEEERSFVAILEESPPALVVRTVFDADDSEARAPERVAPQVWAWIRANYTALEAPERGIHLLVPNERWAERRKIPPGR
ncbi:MAG: glycosyltransferase family 39 protein [Myxococcota bacterium]